MDHNKLWKLLKEMEILDYLNCLLRNLHAGQEATVRTGHGAMDWLKLGKEYIMRNARLDEVKGGIKIFRRNIKSLIYADDTSFMKESKEELKSLLMKVKES